MVSSGGKALDCGLGVTLDLSSTNLLRRLDRRCSNTPFSRVYTLVTRQRRVCHRRADPLRRAGLKPRPFVPRIICNGAAQVLHWHRDQQYSQYAAHAGPSFDGADCDAKACGQSCDPNIDNAERPIALMLNQLAVELCINLLETDLKVVFPFGFRERIQVYRSASF